MTTPRTRFDYAQLATIAARFARESENCAQSTQQLRGLTRVLEQAWVGQAGSAFQSEMHEIVLPSLVRLSAALTSASDATKQISAEARAAEDAAAKVLSGSAIGQLAGMPPAGDALAAADPSSNNGWPGGINPFAPIGLPAGTISTLFNLAQTAWNMGGKPPFGPISLAPEVANRLIEVARSLPSIDAGTGKSPLTPEQVQRVVDLAKQGFDYAKQAFEKFPLVKWDVNPLTGDGDISIGIKVPPDFEIVRETQGLFKTFGVEVSPVTRAILQQAQSTLPVPIGDLLTNEIIGGRTTITGGDLEFRTGIKYGPTDGFTFYGKGAYSGLTLKAENVVGDEQFGTTSASEIKIGNVEGTLSGGSKGRNAAFEASVISVKKSNGLNIDGANYNVSGDVGIGFAKGQTLKSDEAGFKDTIMAGPVPIKYGVKISRDDAVKPVDTSGSYNTFKVTPPLILRTLRPDIAGDDGVIEYRDSQRVN
jgi:WXG100 family type VII secretion target